MPLSLTNDLPLDVSPQQLRRKVPDVDIGDTAMKLREFICGLGGAAVWPFGARAQQGDVVGCRCSLLWTTTYKLIAT
jgi:hypothetical protein